MVNASVCKIFFVLAAGMPYGRQGVMHRAHVVGQWWVRYGSCIILFGLQCAICHTIYGAH